MLPHLRSRWLAPLCAISLAVVTSGCDDLLTETPPAGDDFETPFDGLSFAFNA